MYKSQIMSRVAHLKETSLTCGHYSGMMPFVFPHCLIGEEDKVDSFVIHKAVSKLVRDRYIRGRGPDL